MNINKVVYGDDTLVDLTTDTVTSSALVSGFTAHDSTGTPISGSLVVNPRQGIFDISDCEYESNISSHTDIGYAGCRFTVTSTNSSAVHIDLDPTKTYSFSWWSENCGIAAFNKNWGIVFSDESGDGPHSRKNITNVSKVYIYILDITSTYTCLFRDLTIVET